MYIGGEAHLIDFRWIEQIAQKLYDETEDQQSQDNKTTDVFLNVMEKFSKIDLSSIDDIKAMVADVKQTMKQWTTLS